VGTHLHFDGLELAASLRFSVAAGNTHWRGWYTTSLTPSSAICIRNPLLHGLQHRCPKLVHVSWLCRLPYASASNGCRCCLDQTRL